MGDVLVAEAGDRVLAGQGCSEQCDVGAFDGVEPAVAASPVGPWLAEPVQGLLGVTGGLGGAQRVQIALVGALADLEVAGQVGYPFPASGATGGARG